MATANVSPIICGNNETSGARGAFRLEMENVNNFFISEPKAGERHFYNMHFTIFHGERGCCHAYPLGISPMTLTLYLLVRLQKWVMIVAAMTCWRQTQEFRKDLKADNCGQHAPCWAIEGQRERNHDSGGPTTMSSIGMGKGSFFL